ncbi:MAG: hypothetical protein U1E23_12590 [Reyranellaceae bacterium]
MTNVKGLIVVGLVAATTAACADPYGYQGYNTGYANTGYGGYNSAYYGGGRSFAAPAYVASPGYVSRPASTAYYAQGPRRYGPNGDYDRDGVPNKYDRDANGDGVPDRFQR